MLTLGLLFFKEGDVYLGELDANCKPSGAGTMFFKTGCILRGFFEDNMAHGKCLLSLPTKVFFVLKFNFGVLDTWSTKIDLNTAKVHYYRFSKGTFEEEREGEDFTKTLPETLRDIFPENWALNPIDFYKEGDYFGSVMLPSGQIFNGFFRDGVEEGWGITITFNPNHSPGECYC
jgi:hypothetical protein